MISASPIGFRPISAGPSAPAGPAEVVGYIDVPSPLGAVAIVGAHDFTGLLGVVTTCYVMDLITPTGLVRVPISSWQATLQLSASNYAQCVVPACAPWLLALGAATEFRISRIARKPDGSAYEYVMLQSPFESLVIDRGPYRYTATLSGYTAGIVPPGGVTAIYDRHLAGVRFVSMSGGKTRVRCAIDWLLRPGQTAYLDGTPITVEYINYYGMTTDEYCDVGGAS